MLILSRKRDQTIVVGDDITITVVETRRNSVLIGIDAPDDVSIRRGELTDGDIDEHLRLKHQPHPDPLDSYDPLKGE